MNNKVELVFKILVVEQAHSWFSGYENLFRNGFELLDVKEQAKALKILVTEANHYKLMLV